MYLSYDYINPNLITNNNVKMNFNWQSKTLLIIEDDYASYLFLKEVLLNTEIKIIRAISLKQAIENLTLNIKIDMVIMNINIYGDNIHKSISEVKRYCAYTPIIAITEQDSIDAKSDCIQAGCDTFIYRHIDRFQLLNTIDELLDRSNILNSLNFRSG